MSYEPKSGKCPVCGLSANVDPGQTVPEHQPPGERGRCPGSGQTAQ